MPPERSHRHLRVSSVVEPHNDRRKHWATNILAFGGSLAYSNEGLRNVQIWSSETWYFSSNSMSLMLLGGFYQSDPNDTSHHFSNEEIYDMLNIILISKRNSDTMQGNLLLKLEEDPRTAARLPTTSELAALPQVYRSTLGHRNSHQIDLEAGHYLLVEYNYTARDRYAVVPINETELKDPKVFSRSRKRDESKLASRKPRVVAEVRRRDGRCRISGEEAPMMERGYNVGGLEAAHIYPLAYAREIYEDAESIAERTFIATLGETNNAYNIDDVRNAILLRRDVHILFDDYQFSVISRRRYGENGRPIISWDVVRFEEDAAEYISDDPAPRLLDPLNLCEVSPVSITSRRNEVLNLPVVPVQDAIFLRMHYRTAVRWHVAGAGRQPARRAILVQEKVIW